VTLVPKSSVNRVESKKRVAYFKYANCSERVPGLILVEKGERMLINSRLGLFLLVLLLCTPQISARQYHAPTFPGDGKIHLDVVVTPKSDPAVSGLQQQDFSILDNGVPQTIISFEAVGGRLAPIEVVLVIDAVNIGAREAATVHEEINRFLKTDGGHLDYPTAVAILTVNGLQFQEEFSKDGNAASATLGDHTIPIRGTGRDADRGGAADRVQISFQGFADLLGRERERPGRKLILCVSPGWPPLFGLENTRDASRQEQVFGNIVEISTQLLEGQITVYSVDPSALGDVDPGLTDPPAYHLRPSDRKAYIEGVSKASDVRMEDLTLGAIATQSGGLALHPGNDLAAELQKCVADAGAYYEISFDPSINNHPTEYHKLEVHVAKPGLTARTRQGYYSLPGRAGEFTAGSGKTSKVEDETLSLEPGTESVTPEAFSQQVYYANAHPYFDLPLALLVDHIPELKTLQPAPDQQELPVILQKMGQSVDNFMREIGDLIAHEDVTQEKLNKKGGIQAKQRVQDNYLILHHGYEWGASAEYRMDDKGNRLGRLGLEKGYLVTAGHALSCISFATVAQAQSKFRYFGEEKIGSRETYVLGFAQKPGEVTFRTVMRGTGGAEADMLTQGILWVDKNNFQIIRMRSDLLAPQNEIGLDQLTTEVTFAEVQLQDVPNPLWLPSDVDVSMEIKKQKFHNVHHYTNYRRYRVSVKIGNQQ
jgi:VWFA-related protein